MSEDKTVDDVEGTCPQCYKVVAVYAAGGKLKVRAHKHSVSAWRGTRHVTCPVRDIDGADALARSLKYLTDRAASAARRVAERREALAREEAREVEAQNALADYTAKVDALKARVRS